MSSPFGSGSRGALAQDIYKYVSAFTGCTGTTKERIVFRKTSVAKAHVPSKPSKPPLVTFSGPPVRRVLRAAAVLAPPPPPPPPLQESVRRTGAGRPKAAEPPHTAAGGANVPVCPSLTSPTPFLLLTNELSAPLSTPECTMPASAQVQRPEALSSGAFSIGWPGVDLSDISAYESKIPVLPPAPFETAEARADRLQLELEASRREVWELRDKLGAFGVFAHCV